MAVLVDQNVDLSWGGWVGKSTGGEYACVMCEQIAGDGIVAYIDLLASPNKIGVTQTGTMVFGAGGDQPLRVSAVMDSNNVIHVVAISSSDDIRDVAYATISDIDGTPAWSSWEEVQSHDLVTGMVDWHVDITVDSNDIPHVLHTQYTRIHGTNYLGVYYTNRIGGTWAVSVDSPMSSPQANYSSPRISIKAGDELEVMFYGMDDGDQYYNSTSGGSWGTQGSHADSSARTGKPCMLIATGGTIYRVYHQSGNIKEDGVDTTYNTLTGGVSYVVSGKFLEPSTRYIVYIDQASNDIYLLVNTGSGWVDRGALEVGTYEGVFASWQYLNNNNPNELLYIFEDNNFDVRASKLDLARRIFIT